MMRYARFMKRTTVMLPDETIARLRQEARTRGSSVAEVVRTAVERHLAEPVPTVRRDLAFFAIGEGGPPHDAASRVDEVVWEALQEDKRKSDEVNARR